LATHVSRTHEKGVRASGVGTLSLADATDRARLISDITKLVRDSPMPESTRLAGLTLIGWLARRHAEEAPHAIGIEEARKSERRIRPVRSKER
jgi:hypothetical protein